MHPWLPVAFETHFLIWPTLSVQVMPTCLLILRQLYQRVQPWFVEQKPNEEDWAQVVYALARSGRATPRWEGLGPRQNEELAKKWGAVHLGNYF